VTNLSHTTPLNERHLIKIKVFPTGKNSKKIWL
jgi:hypothetical protein